MNKPLSGLLVYRLIMSLAERKISHLPSKLRFSAKCSFFFSQPRTLSADIPAAERGLFTNYFSIISIRLVAK